MTKCTGTKFLAHNPISLTFWTIFFTENIGYPFKNFPVIGTWGTKYFKWIELIPKCIDLLVWDKDIIFIHSFLKVVQSVTIWHLCFGFVISNITTRSIPAHPILSNDAYRDFHLWPKKSKEFILSLGYHVCEDWWISTCNGLVYHYKLISFYVHCDLEL